jgi:hypothetical protein
VASSVSVGVVLDHGASLSAASVLARQPRTARSVPGEVTLVVTLSHDCMVTLPTDNLLAGSTRAVIIPRGGALFVGEVDVVLNPTWNATEGNLVLLIVKFCPLSFECYSPDRIFCDAGGLDATFHQRALVQVQYLIEHDPQMSMEGIHVGELVNLLNYDNPKRVPCTVSDVVGLLLHLQYHGSLSITNGRIKNAVRYPVDLSSVVDRSWGKDCSLRSAF